ncbi:ankyrin, partial [Colletotrichum sublineola]
MVACTWRYTRIVEHLLTAGAIIDAPAEHGRHALHFASLENHTKLVQFLLNKLNPPVAKAEEKAKIPLHYTSIANHPPTDRLLSFLNQGDDYGWTALHLASMVGNESVVRLLLDTGASIDQEDEDGKTALHIAYEQFKSGRHDCVIKLLLTKGANPVARTGDNQTALHIAKLRGSRRLQILLEQ